MEYSWASLLDECNRRAVRELLRVYGTTGVSGVRKRVTLILKKRWGECAVQEVLPKRELHASYIALHFWCSVSSVLWSVYLMIKVKLRSEADYMNFAYFWWASTSMWLPFLPILRWLYPCRIKKCVNKLIVIATSLNLFLILKSAL